MPSKIVICPGSFDPPTNGHLNIIKRALTIFDKVIIAVATNTTKNPIFTPKERVEILREIFKECKDVEVDTFRGLLVDYCRKRGSNTVLRGIRNMSDYEYETQMALANKTLYPELEFLYLMTEGQYSHLSSSIIKEVLTFGGTGSGMIHPIVEKKLKEKLKK
ncbi:MAG: pantetheine-phosphate adenylyltransferase [Deltaproteobacteria bacterium CG11_big_fil_rev_8_21_14_0_20_49_13]|nr:MAG: pantetheine-phosphate adenylyltransferase [Deltaproteobacteria bacterium CG11_big_fil_rev_8_21_14_0_20_49_13]